LGACDHAPVVMVGDKFLLDITDDAVNEILRR
jgi:NADH-quinone oxidoreductase subunit E